MGGVISPCWLHVASWYETQVNREANKMLFDLFGLKFETMLMVIGLKLCCQDLRKLIIDPCVSKV